MSLVVGSRISSSLGWSLASGCKPAAVLRLLWYRLGLFLYSWSSSFQRESTSLRLALFMMVAMALLHEAGMSSRLGGSRRCASLACAWVCLVCWGSVVNGLLVFRLGSICLAVFPSRVMRLSCLVSDFVMGGWSLVLVSLMNGWAIDHIVCASRWYSSMDLTTSFAALSIWSVVAWLEPRKEEPLVGMIVYCRCRVGRVL